jgi:hypothetical protein
MNALWNVLIPSNIVFILFNSTNKPKKSESFERKNQQTSLKKIHLSLFPVAIFQQQNKN